MKNGRFKNDSKPFTKKQENLNFLLKMKGLKVLTIQNIKLGKITKYSQDLKILIRQILTRSSGNYQLQCKILWL
jgi:hypothetical protein